MVYVQGMLDGGALVVTPPAAEIGRQLFRPLVPGTGPLLRRYGELTAQWLPERLAEGFGLGRRDGDGRRRSDAFLRRAAQCWPYLPRRLRYLPPYVEAHRRVAGRRDRDRIGEALLRLWMGRARPL